MSYLMIDKDLNLGATREGGQLFLKEKVRKTHMHVIGVSGRGKTFFLERMIRQDIKNGDGVCLIDPHGLLYHNIVAWCAEQEEEHAALDNLILLDATAPGWTYGFNPLNFGACDTSFSVDSMVNACAQVWGGEDTSAKPRMKLVLRGVFHALAEKGHSLIEALHLIDEGEEYRPLRRYLTQDLRDPFIRGLWAKWNKLKPAEFREQFESATNRLAEFVSADIMRRIIGQTECVIDFQKIMDEGRVVLVNLEPKGTLSADNARTLGTLITNDLFMKAQSRPEGSRPFYLYIDECGRYLNESIERILDESRKRGLHLILANQHLAQLRAAGQKVYGAVMGDAQTKVVFGGLPYEDAETVVKEVFLDLDLEEPKQSLTRKAAAGQEKVILRGESAGSSSTNMRSVTKSDSTSRSEGTSTGEMESSSITVLPSGGEGATIAAWGLTGGNVSGASWASGTAVSEAVSSSVSEINSWTESFRTIYEEAVGGHFSLDEQRYKKIGWLKKQPQQMALLVLPDYSLFAFRVSDVRKPKIQVADVERFMTERFEALPFVSPTQQIIEHIENRTTELKQLSTHDTPVVDEQFDPWGNT